MDIARELFDGGYKADKYRAAYGNLDFCIRPPSIETLATDTTLLPPATVDKTAGRPRGGRKRKRGKEYGEDHTSSKYNTKRSASSGAASAAASGAGSGAGSGAAAGAAAGGAAGSSLSQPSLSHPSASQLPASQPSQASVQRAARGPTTKGISVLLVCVSFCLVRGYGGTTTCLRFSRVMGRSTRGDTSQDRR